MIDLLPEQWEAAQTAYKGKIATFARNSSYAVPGYDEVDMEQELLIVLWQCVRNYDPGKGARFNSYFQGSAKNRIVSLIRAANTKGRQAEWVSLDVEAVQRAVDEVFQEQDPEATAILRITLREAIAEHGVKALDGRRGGKRRASAA